ncbi:MAG: hypothetical protein KDA32_03555 [Phycisphaerales bacterium]|nr:hypothetical protein [Phycisphaerales bacterium]
MTKPDYELVGDNYANTSLVPKDRDLVYRCKLCGGTIPSLPARSIGCGCGNVAIDKDCWRLYIGDYGSFEVLRRI